jgi:cyclase
MIIPRVIPCLLLSGNGLVKTTNFANPKYVGDPINAIRIFNEKEVDELMIIDIKATYENRGPDFNLIEQLASECFMPLCYGGGIRDMNDVHTLFKLGIEKVAIQSAVFLNPSLINEIAGYYGQQAVVVSMDVKRNWLGAIKLFSHNKNINISSKNWREYVKYLENLGAGEILLNSVDKDGKMDGVDLELIAEVSKSINIPVVAIGGIGSLNDIKSAINAGASAVAAGSFFVFQGPHRAVLITYPKYKELQNLWKI